MKRFNNPFILQARVINELAKKVFDVLRINPNKFEMEFSETRRQVGQRNQGDFRDSTDMKSDKITIGVPSKDFRTNHRCSDTAKHVHARDVEVPTGKRELLA